MTCTFLKSHCVHCMSMCVEGDRKNGRKRLAGYGFSLKVVYENIRV